MTTDELNAIGQAVMLELEKAGVDFDFKAETPQADDLVYVMRGTADKYQGITVKWQNLLGIIVQKATEARDDAITAKDIALQTLATIQGIASNVSTMKSSVETMTNNVSSMKASVEASESNVTQMKTAVSEMKTNVENMKNGVNDIYNDFNNLKVNLVSQLYPVGSIYISLKDECSPASIIANSEWERLPEGKALWTASSGLSITDNSVNTVGAGLPNITCYFRNTEGYGLYGNVGGAFSKDPSSQASFQPVDFLAGSPQIEFNASNSNSIYGNSDTVQPPAYKVYAWKRIA